MNIARFTLGTAFAVGVLAGLSPTFTSAQTTSTSDSSAKAAPDSTGNGRALAQPLPSPPFPSGDWLGSPLIGEPPSNTDGALMHALSHTGFGQALQANRISIYGWVDPSVNFSTSKNTNLPLSYAIVPNRVELDQVMLLIERQPNTAQTDHIDWGFRLEGLYGTDYRFTTAKGYFSDQLLQRNALYGFDPIEMYGLLYIPKVAEGLEFKIGRFISPPDIEAQLATNNYLFSHSIMFTFDPYTFTGVQATLRLSQNWQLEGALHAGNDMAPWSNSARLNGNLMVRWTSTNGDDGLWGGINSLGNGQFTNGHDNLQQVVGTWGHRFNDRWHMMTEAYYMWEFNAATGGSCVFGQSEAFAGGGGCGPIIPGRSYSVGAVNYLQYLIDKKSYLSLRNDYFDDPQGQRSGFATAYTSHTLGYIHDFFSWLVVRPEIRYERAYMPHVTPYDLGTKPSQFTIASDVIVKF
jgi:putative OmpL-like beta-barrel porin-2